MKTNAINETIRTLIQSKKDAENKLNDVEKELCRLVNACPNCVSCTIKDCPIRIRRNIIGIKGGDCII